MNASSDSPKTEATQQVETPRPISSSLQDLQNKYLTPSSVHHPQTGTKEPGSITIENLDSCIVDLSSNPLLPALADRDASISRQSYNTVYLKNLKNSVIVLGPAVLGSLFLDSIENCLIVAAAQQVSGISSLYRRSSRCLKRMAYCSSECIVLATVSFCSASNLPPLSNNVITSSLVTFPTKYAPTE